jgi:hypothetical protein
MKTLTLLEQMGLEQMGLGQMGDTGETTMHGQTAMGLAPVSRLTPPATARQ